MKYISKIIAVALSAVTLLSGSTAVAGAAKIKNCVQVKVINCNRAECGNIGKLLSKSCTGKNCKTTVKTQSGYCPGGNCSTKKPAKAAKNNQKQNEPAASAEFNSAYEAEVLRLVNIERNKKGLSPLALDNGATNVAHLRAKEIVKSFSHTRPDGSSCFTAAKELGVAYRTAGENIAYGYSSPEQVVNGWMNSEGHRKNILSASFGKIGIGCYKSGNTLYWSQFFIG